jgi:6-phosphogluconolactonase
MLTRLQQFEAHSELCDQLAHWIAADLAAAISKRGAATLAVSGGSTPLPLFQRLSTVDIDWARVSVTQVDERWLEEDHSDANARLIREALLVNAAAAANFVGMKTEHSSPFDPGAVEATVARLSAFCDGIDVVVLGMGGDGHTASFFPDSSTLAQALDLEAEALCVPVLPPSAPHERMTLSLTTLLRASNIYLHITGASKWKVLEQALQGGDPAELPIRAVLFNRNAPIELFYTRDS